MTNKFVAAVLKTVNKDEKQIQKEKIEQFAQEALIDAQLELANVETGDLQKAKLKLARNQNQVVKAKKAFEESRFRTDKNFESYLAFREQARKKVYEAEQEVSQTEAEIKTFEDTIEQLKLIIADFS